MKNLNSVLGLFLILATSSSCSMKPKSMATLHFDISDLIQAAEKGTALLNIPKMDLTLQMQLEKNLSEAYASENYSSHERGEIEILVFPTAAPIPTPSPPSTLDEFSCFILNVMGPGIPSNEPYDPNEPPISVRHARAALGAPTAYEGIISSPFTLTSGQPSSISVNVPAGPARVVQVIGLRAISSAPGDVVYDFCTGATSSIPHGNGAGGDGFFVVASSFIPSVFSDVAVTMTQDYLSRPSWYKEYKRLHGGYDGCKSFGGFFTTGGASALGTADAFAIELDTRMTGFSIPVNRLRVELANSGGVSTTVMAKLYVNSSAPSGGAQFPGSAAQIVASSNTYTLGPALPATTFEFNFPLTQLPGNTTPFTTRSYLIVYGSGTPFEMMGQAGGSYSVPQISDALYSGTWAAGGGVKAYLSIDRCF